MLGRLLPRERAQNLSGLSVYDWAKMWAPGATVSYGGNRYQGFKIDQPGAGIGYYQSSSVVFALEALRILLFSEARFQFQQMRGGRPGDLFGNDTLSILEQPWAGHTTRDLLAQAELDVAHAGNSYWIRRTDGLLRLAPEKVTIVTDAVRDELLSGQPIGERLLGYFYKPDPRDERTWTVFQPSEVAHYKPYPNPMSRFVGQSWLTACMADLDTDDAITTHKNRTLKRGAPLSTMVSFDESVSPEEAEQFIAIFRRDHEGPDNAGKTLFLGGGADVKTVGQSFENLALKATQGSGETRIAACAGIPPVVVGFSEGLQGSSLNAGNYAMARRRLADMTMRPLWGTFAAAMETLVPPQSGSRLWYDDRDIAFIREDQADQASIVSTNAQSLQVLINAGFEPNAAVEAVLAGDFGRLADQHTGLTSVQLQPPGAGELPKNGQAMPKNGMQPAAS